MDRKQLRLSGALAWLLVSFQTGLAGDGYVFEKFGEPVRIPGLSVRCVTKSANGEIVGWGAQESPEGYAVVGVRVENGELIWLDTGKYGRSHIQMTTGVDGNLYFYTGRPGRFLRYDVNKGEVEDLGVPARKATYWLGSTLGPDGHHYVGSYPATHLVRCNTRTGEIEDLGRMAEDPRECYLIHPAISDGNVAYCPVGLHHMELWAYDLKTRTKKQILPEDLTKKQGAPKAWVGTDGKVYGSAGSDLFRCRPDRIEMGKTKGRRRSNAHRTAGGKVIWGIREDGALTMTDLTKGAEVKVQTKYPGTARKIFCVACEHDGKIYGGTISPAHAFSYDIRTGRLKDLGRLTGGRIQIYDILSHPQGLFMASYVGAHLDLYRSEQPREAGLNPRHIASLSKDHMQERPMQVVQGPDGKLYTGTIPVKGHLGGALARVDPADLTYEVWRDLIPNQSLYYLAAVPETGEVLCTTSVRGGSSAKPTEKEACIFLWDTQKEEVTFECKPIAGAKHYGCVTRARNGVVYGLAGNRYYALDPKVREVVFRGELPVKRVRYPGFHDMPVGPNGVIVGIGDDAIFAIDPSDHCASILARDASLKHTHGFCVARDGGVYYGSGPALMRARPVTAGTE